MIYNGLPLRQVFQALSFQKLMLFFLRVPYVHYLDLTDIEKHRYGS